MSRVASVERSSRDRSAIAALGAAGVSALVTLGLSGAVADASPVIGKTFACYSKSSGALTLPAKSSKCASGQVKVSWNTLLAAGKGGASGAQGARGAQGSQGVPGSQGPQGLPGGQGPAGAPGAQGAQGARGLQGSQGSQGVVGSQGSQGPQGFVGPRGTEGPQGDHGPGGTAIAWVQSLGTNGTLSAGHLVALIGDVGVSSGDGGTQVVSGTLNVQGAGSVSCHLAFYSRSSSTPQPIGQPVKAKVAAGQVVPLVDFGILGGHHSSGEIRQACKTVSGGAATWSDPTLRHESATTVSP
jgi:Collagen triple helix repeat (20 copies)